MGAPGHRRQRERGQRQPAEAARRRHPDERLQVEQHEHQACTGLGTGEGGRMRIQPRLHEHRRPRQHEHQQQREDGLQDAVVVETGGIGGVAGPHQEDRHVQHRHLPQRLQAGMGHQVMSEAGDVDHKDQVEEQLQPCGEALLFRSGTAGGNACGTENAGRRCRSHSVFHSCCCARRWIQAKTCGARRLGSSMVLNTVGNSVGEGIAPYGSVEGCSRKFTKPAGRSAGSAISPRVTKEPPL